MKHITLEITPYEAEALVANLVIGLSRTPYPHQEEMFTNLRYILDRLESLQQQDR